jgi:plastocyanin
MTMRTPKSVFLASVLGLWFAAPGFGATAMVTVSNVHFVDATSGTSTTTINAGDTVTWNWAGGSHSTTSGTCTTDPYDGNVTCTPNGTWDSTTKSQGSFSATLSTPGSYHYFCNVHLAMMVGIVVVRPSTNCPTITLAPSSLPAAIVGSPFSATVTASGGASPYVYAVASGALPPGLSLNASSGSISGTPSAPGSFAFALTARDANQCTASQSFSVTASTGAAAGETVVVPGVGSAAGAFGSQFKTQLQLTNATSGPVSGQIIFHALGAPASAGDPSMAYSLASWQTMNINDLLPAMGQTGLGSADISPISGPAPVALARIYNDAGTAGTTGFTEQAYRPERALAAGDTAILIVPADLTNFRFNMGVRTMSNGATAVFTIWDSSGAILSTVTSSYPASFYTQTTGSQFLNGATLPANGSIEVSVTTGAAIFFGSTVDNRTQDPSAQFTLHD